MNMLYRLMPQEEPIVDMCQFNRISIHPYMMLFVPFCQVVQSLGRFICLGWHTSGSDLYGRSFTSSPMPFNTRAFSGFGPKLLICFCNHHQIMLKLESIIWPKSKHPTNPKYSNNTNNPNIPFTSCNRFAERWLGMMNNSPSFSYLPTCKMTPI